MLVLHVVTRLNVGGVATLVRELSAGLPAQGVDVVVACGEVQAGERESPDRPDNLVRVSGLGRSVRPGDDLRALIGIRQLLRRVRPDIVHTHTAKAGLVGRSAAQWGGARLVHTFHGHLLHGYFSPRMTSAVTATERALAARTDLLVSSGLRVGQELRAAGIGMRRRWVNIPPGVAAPIGDATRELDTVAFVGRLVQIKRPDRLLAVARLMPHVRFLVAGDGPERAQLEAARLPNLELLGWVRDLGAVYRRAQLVLLCSDNEAMPLALIEGALCGIPAVTTDAGSSAEVVQHGATGLVSDGAPAHLAAAIDSLLRDDAQRETMGAAAAVRAQAHHSVEAMCRAHAEAYRGLLPP